jgi:hypothetical protein
MDWRPATMIGGPPGWLGAESIRYSLGLILLVHLVAAAFLLRAGATLRKDLREKAKRGDGTRRPS